MNVMNIIKIVYLKKMVVVNNIIYVKKLNLWILVNLILIIIYVYGNKINVDNNNVMIYKV